MVLDADIFSLVYRFGLNRTGSKPFAYFVVCAHNYFVIDKYGNMYELWIFCSMPRLAGLAGWLNNFIILKLECDMTSLTAGDSV